MIKRFFKDEQGGLVEYLILLSVMSVCSVLIFPSLRTNLVEWNNTMICNVTKGIGGSGDCGNKTNGGDDGGFNTTDPNKPPTTVDPPKEETKPPEKEVKYVVKYDRTIPFRYSNVMSHEVKVVLNTSNFDYSLSKKEGKDIKFLRSTGQVLNTFIEKWNPKGESIIWVKSIGTDTDKLDMVIDDSYTSANDPNKVFIFYETFDKPLDPKIWDIPSKYEDRVEVKDGVLYLDRATIGLKKQLWMRYATIKVDTKLVEGQSDEGSDIAIGLMISNKLLSNAGTDGFELLAIHPSDNEIEDDNYTYLEMVDHTGAKDSQKGTRYYSHGYRFPVNDWAKYDIFLDSEVRYDYAYAKQRGDKEYLGDDVINELPNRNYLWLGYWSEDPDQIDFIYGKMAFDSIIVHQGEEPINGTVVKQ